MKWLSKGSLMLISALSLASCASGPAFVPMPAGYAPFNTSSGSRAAGTPSVAAPPGYTSVSSGPSLPRSAFDHPGESEGTTPPPLAPTTEAELVIKDSRAFAITSPQAAAGSVPACPRQVRVSGQLHGALPAGSEVVILVHPLETQSAWVQNQATCRDKGGHVEFESMIALGEWGREDCNKFYEVFAAVAPAGQYRYPGTDPLSRIPADMNPVSSSILLYRDRD